MNEDNLNKKHIQHDLMLFLSSGENCLQQDDTIFLNFSPSVIVKSITLFFALNYALSYMHVLFSQYCEAHIGYQELLFYYFF